MKFIHISDPHLVPRGELLWGLDPFARFDACLADIAAHHADAAFCVITGDLADRPDTAIYGALKKRLEAFPLRCQLLLGNHDGREAFASVFSLDEAGFAQSSIVHDGRHFIFIDTLGTPPSSAGIFCEPRRNWLARHLAEAKGAPVFLFLHHPPFDIGIAKMDGIKLKEPEVLARLLVGHDVRHLFFGHAHRAMSGQWRGIPFSALPSLNHQLPLVETSVATVYSDEPAMYAVVLVSNDSTVVHYDAFLHRAPARMREDEEREDWY